MTIPTRRSTDGHRFTSGIGDHVAVQRVHRLLARGENIGIALDQREAAPDPVVQEHASSARDQAAAKSAGNRLDERDHAALAIRRAQIGRIAVRKGAGHCRFTGAKSIDRLVAPSRPSLAQ